MILALALGGCSPAGDGFATSKAFDGPARHVIFEDGEVAFPFVVGVEPVGAAGKAPRVDFGFDVAWTVTTAGPATVRVVTFTDEDTWVPTPWEVRVNGEETFAQSSVGHTCDRGEERCEVAYEAAIEVREGGAADISWTVAAWVEGRPGSAAKISDDTALDVVFE